MSQQTIYLVIHLSIEDLNKYLRICLYIYGEYTVSNQVLKHSLRFSFIEMHNQYLLLKCININRNLYTFSLSTFYIMINSFLKEIFFIWIANPTYFYGPNYYVDWMA